MTTTATNRASVDGGSSRPAVGRRPRRLIRSPKHSLQTLAFFAPGVILFGYFAWWPMVSSVILSLQETNLVAEPSWVWLENYAFIFTDPLLWKAVQNTLLFAGISIVLGFPLPLFLATVMSEFRRLGGLFRVLVYLPAAVPPVVAVLLWKWFYEPTPDGVFNTILGTIGIGPLPWLESTSWAIPSLVLAATWSAAGNTVLIYLAALTSIPTELYDAAEVDGAGIWRRVWHITLPQMRGVMLILLLVQIIATMQTFIEPFVMTDGGPQNSTVTVLLLIYRYAFNYGDYGGAAALSVLLAIVLGIISAIYLRVTRTWSTT
ncbi:sugar ABC transporter permease [Ruania alkalisoli]|uniref:Sugar ABC transporter permease n=1 Tax=Ruania alkalisoli TaxID=2779775 RepID=A0A7M1SS46_9MICO|nr:sugar ABC transporter permease [Ruania alkalisoli]QOR70281.1 sugar ABC transporter permease [Ruania alkalisoli]